MNRISSFLKTFIISVIAAPVVIPMGIAVSAVHITGCIPGMDLGAIAGQVGQTAGGIHRQQVAADERGRATARRAEAERQRQEAFAQQRAAEEERRRQAAEAERQRQAVAAAQAEQLRAEAEAQRIREERLRAEAAVRAQELAQKEAAAELAGREQRCAAERDGALALATTDNAPLARPVAGKDPGCEENIARLTELAQRYGELVGQLGSLQQAIEVRHQNCLAGSDGPAGELLAAREKYQKEQGGLKACLVAVAERKAEEKKVAAEERRMAAAAQAVEERKAKIEAATQDPKVLAPLLSAEICWYQRDRKESLDAIAKEKRYARIGGVVDRKALYDWQGDIRRADEKIPPLQRQLRDLKLKVLSCADRLVGQLSLCFNPMLGGVIEGLPDHCERDPFSSFLEVARALPDDD